MREIKFRRWYPGLRVMSKPRTLDWMMFAINSAFSKDDEAIWLQHTGLKDKNGREIYEGDILKWHDTYHRDHFHTVAWSDEWACFDFPMYATDGGKYFYEFEVIGNIYENPELLKEHK